MHYFSTLFGKNSTCFGQNYFSSSGVKTVFTAIGILNTSYVDCLLVRWGSSLGESQHKYYDSEYSIKTPADGQ